MESGFLTFILVSYSAVYSSHVGITGMKYLIYLNIFLLKFNYVKSSLGGVKDNM